MTQDITVASRPRSGTTWLIRMLADALDSPAVAQYRENIDPHEYFGEGRNGGYLIRKTHDARNFHSPTVVIMRDPRDVAVSRFHWNRDKYPDLTQTIRMMGTCYEAWYLWWETKLSDPLVDHITAIVNYENLKNDGVNTLLFILEAIVPNNIPSKEKIEQAYNNQSFKRMHNEHPHAARKGIIGDWMNHFTRYDAELITDILGNFMLRYNYIDKLDWYEEIQWTN